MRMYTHTMTCACTCSKIRAKLGLKPLDVGNSVTSSSKDSAKTGGEIDDEEQMTGTAYQCT